MQYFWKIQASQVFGESRRNNTELYYFSDICPVSRIRKINKYSDWKKQNILSAGHLGKI